MRDNTRRIRRSPSYRALAMSSGHRGRIPRGSALSLSKASMEPEVLSCPQSCHQMSLRSLESRGEDATVRNTDRRSLGGKSGLPALAIERRLALVITSGTGIGTGMALVSKGGYQDRNSVKPMRQMRYVSSLNHEKEKYMNNSYQISNGMARE